MSYLYMDELQSLGDMGRDIKIGVVDGLCDKSHPLIKNVEVIGSKNGQIKTGHGTAVCGIISGVGLGLAPESQILNYPVFEENEQGDIKGCSERVLASAILETAKNGVDVINVSGASISVSGVPEKKLEQAIEYCKENNILIVAATGNEGRLTETLPASIDYVLAVGACNSSGIPAKFNNYGKKLSKKTLLASGTDIPVVWPNESLSKISGSSFAAPVVTSVIALTINALKKHTSYREVTPELIKSILFESSKRVLSEKMGGNRSTYSRLSVPGLINRLKREIQKTSEIKPTGLPAMNNTPDQIDSITPSESINAAEAESNMIQSDAVTVEASESYMEPSSLKLPEISDPAPNKIIHNSGGQIRPQATATDARSMHYEEKVYVIGTVGYDFGTEARMDYFSQVMGQGAHPVDPNEMAKHLQDGDNAEQSSGLIWTLKIDGIPVYAIEPENQFAVLQYARLVKFLVDQETHDVERISIAGYITGEVKLMNGHVVPKISPVLRGMFNWNTNVLAEAALSSPQGNNGQNGNSDNQAKLLLENFLDRVYYELRNMGQDSEERAMNYAASNAYQISEVFDDALKESLFLNKISAEKSPVSRPNSDCWDVVLEFFNPKERLTSARKLYRYTIDVSDIMPVTVGKLRKWYAF